ncbi:Origin recognition complex subunit 3, partial [Orchesella cincta]
TLMEMKRQNEGTTLIHNIKTDLADFIRNLLKQYLPLISSLQFSDIFIFKDLNHVITTLFPANFLQLSEDLVNPGYFLQCSCCSSVDSFSICDSLPDVSIIHKLISEHTTKKVDLNIIYHTYVSIVQTTGKRGGKAATLKDTATASYLIRFRRAVGELQHMGFIKRSKSKPDEISRLTWW